MLIELKDKMKAGFTKARHTVNREVDSMKSKLSELKNRHRETFESMAADIPVLNSALALIKNPYALLAAGLLSVATVGTKAATMAIGWEKSMSKVNVTAQMGKEELQGLSHQILDIGKRAKTDLADAPEAFNKIVSAGMSANAALAMLEPTLEAAKAGFTDIETTAKAAVSVMASSGINDAVRVYDILFATLNKGNAEFADIATYLPKIIPMARNAGISLEDTAGAYAYLTAQGFRAEAAATGLLNVFKSLTETRTIKGFEKIGVKMFDATGRMRGMMPILGDLKTAMEGLTDKQRVIKFGSIGLDSEATSALSSMLQDYEKLSGIVEFTNNSQGQLAQGIKNAETSTDSWNKITNLVKGTMIEIGEGALPGIKEGLDGTYDTMLNIKTETKAWMEQMSWVKWVWDKIKENIQVVFDFIQNTFNEIKSVLLAISDGIENASRFMSGGKFVSVQEERESKKQSQELNERTKENVKYFKDPALVNQVKDEFNIRTDKPLTLGMADEMGDAFSRLKQLNAQKQAFDYAMTHLLTSQDKAAKKFLKEYNIASERDYYRLLKEGKADEVARKLPGLMPKTVTPGSGKTPPGGKNNNLNADTDKVINSSKQTRNISIHFDSYIKGDVISQNNVIKNMSKDELLRFLAENFKRLMANIETGYGN